MHRTHQCTITNIPITQQSESEGPLFVVGIPMPTTCLPPGRGAARIPTTLLLCNNPASIAIYKGPITGRTLYPSGNRSAQKCRNHGGGNASRARSLRARPKYPRRQPQAEPGRSQRPNAHSHILYSSLPTSHERRLFPLKAL